MNKVILIGRLTRDPEIRTTNTGKKVASFSVATSEGKDANGQELVQYFDVSAWDRLAEIVENYVKKGTRVAIVGSLRNRTWDGPDGTKRKATDINARELEILTTRAESEAMQSSQPQQTVASNTSNNNNGATENSTTQQSTSTQQQTPTALPEIDINDLDDMNVQMPF